MEQLLEGAQLCIPTEEGRFQTVDTLSASDAGEHPGGGPQVHRLRLALQRVLTCVGEADRRRRGAVRRAIDPHGPWRGRGLHPGGCVDRIPGDHSFARRTQRHGHLAGDHAGAGGEAFRTGGLTQLGDRGHHVQRRAHASLGVALRRGRSTPDRHHRITDELLDHTPVTPDDRSRGDEVLREQLADLFGVARLRKGGEADQVAEQHRAEPTLGYVFRGGAAVTADTGVGALAEWVAPATTGAPQSPQNVESGSRAAEQTAQVDVSGEPQERQNRLPSALSVSQTAQVDTPSE